MYIHSMFTEYTTENQSTKQNLPFLAHLVLNTFYAFHGAAKISAWQNIYLN